MAKHKILLAEDEVALGTIVKESLETRGYDVIYCADGEEARLKYEQTGPELLVLDVMMPKKDGFSLVREIRKKNDRIPIIFLTAKSRTEDVVEGFGYGANDYLRKPFSMEELIVRIKALLSRHAGGQPSEDVSIGQYTFNFSRQTLRFQDQEEQLTHREAQLLHELYLHKNDLTERTLILNTLWGSDDFFNARSMDVFITKLRKKLSQDTSIQILNVRGYGYKLIC
ncbi:response regulator transcription factor [Roseivirga thermotolerans]|uniref:Transcriptional regulatory protein RprY n=1 Tax=Roseivirga thermotolerans TaxID=1758176 RepID=A0ABQ3ICP5_9BACT|nr:response regulator transcription factor [Roseivirga thermotolerans]GHE74415.1 transcriptional regulatory protein RprY [Roseivirga thermotolerans]